MVTFGELWLDFEQKEMELVSRVQEADLGSKDYLQNSD